MNVCVYSSNDTNTNLANYINYEISLSKNEANQSCIDVCLWNARSLVNKLHDFFSFVYTLNYQIIAITEKWPTQQNLPKDTFPLKRPFIVAELQGCQ